MNRQESGRLGGLARAARLTPERRREIAQRAAAARAGSKSKTQRLVDSLLAAIRSRPDHAWILARAQSICDWLLKTETD